MVLAPELAVLMTEESGRVHSIWGVGFPLAEHVSIADPFEMVTGTVPDIVGGTVTSKVMKMDPVSLFTEATQVYTPFIVESTALMERLPSVEFTSYTPPEEIVFPDGSNQVIVRLVVGVAEQLNTVELPVNTVTVEFSVLIAKSQGAVTSGFQVPPKPTI